MVSEKEKGRKERDPNENDSYWSRVELQLLKQGVGIWDAYPQNTNLHSFHSSCNNLVTSVSFVFYFYHLGFIKTASVAYEFACVHRYMYTHKNIYNYTQN